MSREIKFRAWDKKTNKKYFVAPIDMFGKIVTLQDDIGDTIDFIVRAMHNVELMQFTGLLDRHGVEIYEGDIVKILYTDWTSQLDSHPELSHEEYLDSIALTRVVIWSVQGFYVSHKVDGYAESMEPGAHGYIEVIGNIYENSSLLERK